MHDMTLARDKKGAPIMHIMRGRLMLGLNPGMAQKETSESEAEDEEQGRAGAILQGPKQEAQGWSKTEASRTNKKKRKKQRLQSQQ